MKQSVALYQAVILFLIAIMLYLNVIDPYMLKNDRLNAALSENHQPLTPRYEYRVFSYLLPVKNRSADELLTQLLTEGWQIDTATPINHNQVRVIYILKRPYVASDESDHEDTKIPDA